MEQEVKEFSLRTKSKWGMFFLFSLVGGPMLYAAYLNYSVGELFFAILMVILFLTWAIVILIAVGFKIKLTGTSLYRQGLISPSIIDFEDITTIHFGSTLSNFYVESEDKKIHFGKDFHNHEKLLNNIVAYVRRAKDIDEVKFLGDTKNIQKYTSPMAQEE
ncbi:hypothetical protein CK503_04565 [Aliifodinibius salipaludis]|uniref:DUF304 domain-containing protein n=1 Tax=Fodinibius salipaludis TaxID=2032627 RepID=A0A2A2GD96_9BACT|nr:hypothetical protein [Aliifodinibius salipaludis]PAU94752.1 hypothetical protein CK503_04565 [Aliifodinibius salipaludis]